MKKTGRIRNPFATSSYLLTKKLKTILPYIEGTVLDYGAGFGQYTEALRTEGFEVDCYDPDTEMHNSKLEYIDEVTKSYDTVLVLNVLHHVEDKALFLAKVLSYGKRIIIGELNGNSWLVRWYHRIFLPDEVGLHLTPHEFMKCLWNFDIRIIDLWKQGFTKLHMFLVVETWSEEA